MTAEAAVEPTEHRGGHTPTRPRGENEPPRPPRGNEPAREEREERVAVRVWQIPVRAMHWLLVLSIVVLTVTGLYIGTPVLSFAGRGHLVMAYMRAFHLAFGFVLIAVIVCRIIFAFTGNRWAHWDQFVPVRKEQRANIVPAMRFYTFLSKEPPPAVGHNPMAGATYLVLFLLLVAQSFTGVALQAVVDRGGWEWTLTGWVFDVASIGTVRLVHHLILWLVWGFVVNHVYSAVLMDHVERSGVISSMINGFKYVPRHHLPKEYRPGDPMNRSGDPAASGDPMNKNDADKERP